MKRKFWNWVKNDAEEERTLVLNGEISDETWYGDVFADGILGSTEKTEDVAGGVGAEGMMFSRTAVTNSLLSKLIPGPEEKMTPIEQLEKRLNL